MDATITFTTTDQARYLADMPQLAANGHHVNVDGTTATLTTDALDVLAGLDPEVDGHYDGTYVWIGGSEYRAIRKTGRPALDPTSATSAIPIRLPRVRLADLDNHAADLGVTRSQLIRDYISAALDLNLRYAEVDVVTGIVAIRSHKNIDGSWREAVEVDPWGTTVRDMSRADDALGDLDHVRLGPWTPSPLNDQLLTCVVRPA